MGKAAVVVVVVGEAERQREKSMLKNGWSENSPGYMQQRNMQQGVTTPCSTPGRVSAWCAGENAGGQMTVVADCSSILPLFFVAQQSRDVRGERFRHRLTSPTKSPSAFSSSSLLHFSRNLACPLRFVSSTGRPAVHTRSFVPVMSECD